MKIATQNMATDIASQSGSAEEGKQESRNAAIRFEETTTTTSSRDN